MTKSISVMDFGGRVLAVVAIILFVIGIACESPSVSGEDVKTAPTSVNRDNSNSSPGQQEESNINFKGCWTTLNGKILQIRDEDLRLSTDNFKSVRYLADEELTTSDRTVLRLLDRPQFHMFQEYIAISEYQGEIGDSAIKIENYINLEDLERNERSGVSVWVENDCEYLFDSP
ncbi:MAG TPA: hypothetical protein VMM38_05640 [Aridibacter sp.]|nr:hypothetical protein [Aridibacter sp.]